MTQGEVVVTVSVPGHRVRLAAGQSAFLAAAADGPAFEGAGELYRATDGRVLQTGETA